MKKLVALILVMTMIISLVACGSNGGSSNGNNGDASKDAQAESPAEDNADDTVDEAEPVEVKDVNVYSYTFMDLPSNDAKERVLEKINEIMNPLGVNINLELTNAYSYYDDLAMKLASGETIDLIPILEGDFASFVADGSIQSITEYLNEYGQDILSAIGGEDQFKYLLDACMFNEEVYSIPQLSSKHSWEYAGFNKLLVDKYEMDLSTVKTYQDLEPFMEIIRNNEPGVKPIISGPSTFSDTQVGFNGDYTYEAMGEGIGVLFGEDNWDVVDFYESEQYADFCKTVHGWYEKGFVSSDIVTSGDNVDSYWKTGNAFCFLSHTNSYSEEAEEANVVKTHNVETKVVRLSEPKCTTVIYSSAIPSSSANPEGAMIFLNELYKNPELTNLFYYGVEGVDWEMKDGFITSIDGSSWFSNCSCNSMIWGNYFISGVIAGNEADAIEKTYEFTLSGSGNRSLGFIFDTTDVSLEYSQMQVVLEKYREGLEYGVLDPETELPKFIEELKAAGVDDFIAEKQIQLDQWVEENNK